MSETPRNQENLYEPTPEGLGLALDDAINRHATAITHIEAEKGDLYGRTGGDQLILYPDQNNPRNVIRIAPVGSNADTRRFPADLGLHVTYDSRNDVGSGTYRVDGGSGNRFVQQWNAHPEIKSAIESSAPETTQYASLIEALGQASSEKPAGRSKKVIRALGHLARR